MDASMHVPTKAEYVSYLRDTSNNKISYFGVISRSDCPNTNEFVDPFDGPSHGRYHGLLIDKSSMSTTLGLNLNTIP